MSRTRIRVAPAPARTSSRRRRAPRGLALVIPDLKGKFDGFSLRVPTPTVSVVDFGDRPPPDERRGGQRRLPFGRGRFARWHPRGVGRAARLDGLQGRLALIDRRRRIDLVLGGDMVKVIAWYDNEWGYSCRVADLIAFVAARLPVAAA